MKNPSSPSSRRQELYAVLNSVIQELNALELSSSADPSSSDAPCTSSPGCVSSTTTVETPSTHPVGARVVITRRDKYFRREGVIVNNSGRKFLDVRLDRIPATPYTRECPSVVIKKIPKYVKLISNP